MPQSKTVKIALVAIGTLVVLLFVFKLGTIVGYQKAKFSYRWGENYHKNFGGPKRGFIRDGWRDTDTMNAHGTVGSIVTIDGDTIVMKGSDGVEKTILVSEQTTIRARRETITLSDVKPDDRIVVLGSANDQGQIEAKLIRLFR